MRIDTMVVGGVLVVVAVTAFVVLWLKSQDPVHDAIVQGLAGPLASAAPPASARVAIPAVSLRFDFDSAALRDAEAAKLDALLRVAHATGFKRVHAVGHADRVGAAAYNVKLSERRAHTVKDYMVAREVRGDLVRTSGRGEVEPVSGDACLDMGPERRGNAVLVECLQPDRRVDVTVIVN